MSGPLETFLVFAAVGVLILLAYLWNGSKAQVRDAFGATDMDPVGEFTELSIYRIQRDKDGAKVGVRFPIVGQPGEHALLDAAEALRLADILEKAADGERAS